MLTILPKKNVGDAVRALMDHGGVCAPVERDGAAVFDRLRDASEIRLEARQTIHSARTALLPARDPFLRFDIAAGSWSDIPSDAPRYLVGLHPCDLRALEAFDLWMNDGIPDDRYAAARSAVTLVALRCAAPCGENCFCAAMGSWEPSGFDVLLTDDGDRYLVEATGERGLRVLELWKGIVLPAAAAAERRLADLRVAAENTFTDADGRFRREDLPGAMKRAFNAPWWHDMAERCLDCGQCTAVCPTCTCFAMVDECDLAMTSCTRCRVSDGCMFAPFAEVAGGHNFRRDRHARIRHRMNRKGNWLPARFAVPFCVGCGRCAATCPVEISPWKVFRRAFGEAVDV